VQTLAQIAAQVRCWQLDMSLRAEMESAAFFQSPRFVQTGLSREAFGVIVAYNAVRLEIVGSTDVFLKAAFSNGAFWSHVLRCTHSDIPWLISYCTNHNFLKTIQQALTTLGKTRIELVASSSLISKFLSFREKLREHTSELDPQVAFHGTPRVNKRSITTAGIKAPGRDGIRVVNGQAFGNGFLFLGHFSNPYIS
jgi:hypothetical protein